MNPNNIKKLSDEFISTTNDEHLNKIMTQFNILLPGTDRYKKDIFLNLSDRGLNRLLTLLKNDKEEIRKNAFKVIVNLLGNSEILQNIFCEKFNFNPIGNVIVMNWMPEILKNNIKLNEQILYEMKKTQNDNLKGNKTFWIWPPNNKYNKDNYPDPQKYLLGIYTCNQVQIAIEDKKFETDFDVQELINKLEN